MANENTEMFACWAAEQTQASGTLVDWYSQDIPAATLDPLYNEPENRVWNGPYRFKAFVEFPDQSIEVREEGHRFVWSGGMVWVPIRMVEDGDMPNIPQEGDVVRMWSIPFFDALYNIDLEGGSPPAPEAGYYFDVIDVTEDGHVFDEAAFTGFKCEIKRRTEFTPERRLANQT